MPVGQLDNALDPANDLTAPHGSLDGAPVGCVTVGAGPQGNASTLATLSTVVQVLQARPTLLGCDGAVLDRRRRDRPQVRFHERLAEMTAQVLSTAVRSAGAARRVSAVAGGRG